MSGTLTWRCHPINILLITFFVFQETPPSQSQSPNLQDLDDDFESGSSGGEDEGSSTLMEGSSANCGAIYLPGKSKVRLIECSL